MNIDDRKLLHDYAQSGSESAFDALMERHLGLVYASALRRVNDPQLAQEICQAVFILLARKAASLPRGVVIVGWLYRTTRFVAERSLRAEQRRLRRDQEAYQMQTLSASDDAWKGIAPVLDAALERLGETDRNAILLRFVEDKNHKEVGAMLGLSEEAARKRVDRALEKVRGLLAQQGITLSAAVLAAALAGHAAQGAPAGVASAVKAAVVTSGKAAAGALPSLVSQTLSAWRWAKVKTAAMIVGLGTAVVGLGLVASTREASGPAPVNVQPNVQPIAAAAPASNTQAEVTHLALSAKPSAVAPRGSSLQLRVVAKDTGEPVPAARLAVNTVAGGEWAQRYDLYTDASGVCDVPLPAGLLRLDIGVLSPDWEARYATFRDEAPEQYILRLGRVTNSIGGWLRDETGKPVANAQVWIEFSGTTDYAQRETPRERVGFIREAPVATSDSKGYWSCAIVPEQNPGFALTVVHPDFPPTSIDTSSAAAEQLWKGALVSVMDWGLSLTGHVTDSEGRPLVGAQIVHDPLSTKALNVTSDAQGQFVIPKLVRGDFDFTVMLEGFAPEYRKVSVEEGMSPVEVRLVPGATLRLRMVDQNGVETPGAEAILEQWGERRYALPWRAVSDSRGCIEWNSAPAKVALELCARKEGWCYTRDIHVVADGEEHTVTLTRTLQLSCHVTDADTGLPIAQFKAFPGYGPGDGEAVWERLATRSGINGSVMVEFAEARQPWRVCIEADGYERAISDPVKVDSSGPLEMTLRREKGGAPLPDRTPTANVPRAVSTTE